MAAASPEDRRENSSSCVVFARMFWTFSTLACHQFSRRRSSSRFAFCILFCFFFHPCFAVCTAGFSLNSCQSCPEERQQHVSAEQILRGCLMFSFQCVKMPPTSIFFQEKKWCYVITLAAAIVCNPQSPRLPGLVTWFSPGGSEQRPQIYGKQLLRLYTNASLKVVHESVIDMN